MITTATYTIDEQRYEDERALELVMTMTRQDRLEFAQWVDAEGQERAPAATLWLVWHLVEPSEALTSLGMQVRAYIGFV